jgi:hypothetical protein
MLPVAPAQTAPTGGGAIAVTATFLVAALFYATTLHLAAVFFLGDAAKRAAVAVGLTVAAVSLLLQRWGAVVVLPMSVGVDAAAIWLVYDRSLRETAVLTVLHFAFAVFLGLALRNLIQLL